MILIALGANLPSPVGPPEATLRAALDMLAQRGAIPENVSGFYRTPAWPDAADPTFVNAVSSLTTQLPPTELLELLHEVETRFGRKRSAKNAPRTLDLDLLDYAGMVQTGPPMLPHPRLEARPFVLVPLRDIASDWRHPVSGRGLDTLIAGLGAAAQTPRRLA